MIKTADPLPGVTIIEKGTSIGVATGINGEFTFSTTKKDSVTLLFTFVGMKMKQVLWNGQKTLKRWFMEEDAQEMEEVVVTGYQVIKKSNMAGSVSTIGAEDLILNRYPVS